MSYALRSFGYNVSDQFTMTLIQAFDKYGEKKYRTCTSMFFFYLLFFLNYNIGNGDITFDNFVQACVTLSSLTNSFRARDHASQGFIQINYEDVRHILIATID
jgi:Ca2+-binding EF-hand superfamily protein